MIRFTAGPGAPGYRGGHGGDVPEQGDVQAVPAGGRPAVLPGGRHAAGGRVGSARRVPYGQKVQRCVL